MNRRFAIIFLIIQTVYVLVVLLPQQNLKQFTISGTDSIYKQHSVSNSSSNIDSNDDIDKHKALAEADKLLTKFHQDVFIPPHSVIHHDFYIFTHLRR